jgi:hypothetical protein
MGWNDVDQSSPILAPNAQLFGDLRRGEGVTEIASAANGDNERRPILLRFLHLCHPPSQLVEPVRDDGSACRADERERLSNV